MSDCAKGHETTRRIAGQHQMPCGCVLETASDEALRAEGIDSRAGYRIAMAVVRVVPDRVVSWLAGRPGVVAWAQRGRP